MTPKEFSYEEQRVQELHSYEILDTIPEKELSDIVELASSICNTPIAQITLIDNTRQWIKATFGLPGGTTDRKDAFCNHTIQTPDQLFEVNDSTLDSRFDSNPYVTGNPHIRFYAGSPLVTPAGYVLGALCVIDTKPGQLSPEARRGLKILTERVMHYLEVRRSNSALRKRLSHHIEQLNALKEANPEGYKRVHSDDYIRLLEQIIFSLSHTIRRPITSLEGLMYLFTEHEEMTPENIKAYAGRMKEVVNELNVYTSHLTRLFLDMRNVIQ